MTGGHADQTVNVDLRGIKKTFHRLGGEPVRAVDDVSLQVGAGEMLVLLGPSGCGKTTLLRCIAGLERPDIGQIWASDECMFDAARHLDIPPERRNLGMMFQSYAVWPHMTVNENVAFPLVSRKVSRSEIPDRVQRVLEVVGIGNLGDQYPTRLSGGQQQRVALARTLVVRPSTVLFDEPLSNVDAKVREELRVELVTQQHEVGFAGVYVTHDQEEALRLATSIAVLDSGHIVQRGSPEEVYRRPATRYVANFVGTVNEFEGTIREVEPSGQTVIETSVGPLVGTTTRSGPPAVHTGDRAVAVVRPELVELSTQPFAIDENVLQGTATASMFTGGQREHVVRLADGAIARVTTMEAAEAGDIGLDRHVWMRVPSAELLIYPL